MNIHPIFVHFPIALFTVYSIIEIARFKKIQNYPFTFFIKAALVIIGFLFSLITLQTGEMAKHLVGRSHLISVHSNFAVISVWIFGIIATLYAIVWINKTTLKDKLEHFKTWIYLSNYSMVIINSPLIAVVALIGLVMITITGALGGAIVFGPDVDPAAKFFYQMFVQ
jgi:uncharacterized membrane protein